MQQRRIRQIPPSIFPFEVIKPNGNVLSVAFGGDSNDPLADSCIPYQMRQAHRNVRRELENLLEEFRCLLIVGQAGIGKTREAAELAQLYNREGWTVLWLKSDGWIDEPNQEQLQTIATNRKLLFVLDNLHQRIHDSLPKLPLGLEESELAPLTVPLQQRLSRVLEVYEQFCGQDKIRVIATARNGEASQWEKLQQERFQVYELPEPENTAIVQLLSNTVPEIQIKTNEEDYLAIAQKNDHTFTNVVVNLRRLRNKGLSLTSNNYIEACQSTWEKCYADAIKKHPASRYIYDAVDLLQQFNLAVERFILEPTALLMMGDHSEQQLQHRWLIRRVLNDLIESEYILNPRQGQIEAKGKQVDANEYVDSLSHLVLRLTDKYPQQMLGKLFNFGCQLLNFNHPKQALTCFDQLLTFNCEISDIWFYRGIALYLSACYEEAVASYDKALTLKSNSYQGWYNRSLTLHLSGCYEEAVDSYNQALAIKPDLDQAWYNRGIALYFLGRDEEAVVSYDKALAIKPDYHQAYYSRCQALENLGRYQEAVAFYDKVLALKPDHYQAWYHRGNALYVLKHYDEAVTSYDQALAIKPDYYQAWYNGSVVLYLLGLYEEVVTSCEKVVALKPDHYQAWYNRANALYFLGHYEEAVAAYDKVILIQPEYDQAWYNRSVALYPLGFYQEVVASCDKAVAIAPDHYKACYNRGNALYSLGKYKEAVASYDQTLAIKPDYYEAWYNRGVAMGHLRDYKEAVASYDKVLENQPHNYQAWYSRGNALNKSGCYEEALISLNKAIELVPGSFEAHYNKACCYALQANAELTLASLQRAISLNPECREMVKTDSNFQKCLKDERFQAMIGD
jgi:tetratricopeptide (TPR) repeat protein